MAKANSFLSPNAELNMTNDEISSFEFPNSQPLQQSIRSISPGNMSQDSCHSIELEHTGKLDVRVKNVPKDFRNISRQQSYAHTTHMPIYNMTSSPRGLALIINNYKFSNNVYEERFGSEFDVYNLKELFEQLYFTVEVKENLKYYDFEDTIVEFAKNKLHAKADMMILVVLSHGKDGAVFTAEGSELANEFIYEQFNNDNCPMLKGKPKFFIMQSCRGDEVDKIPPIIPEKAKRKKAKASSKDDAIPKSTTTKEINLHRPTWEDMVIAYSSIRRFVSMRDPDKGSWFIQSLVQVFMNHAYERELIDLLRLTSEVLSVFTNDEGIKQTCNIEMRHLYKKIYFNPGECETNSEDVSMDEST